MCLYRLATEDEKRKILNDLPPLVHGWKVVFRKDPLPKTADYVTWGQQRKIKEGWTCGKPRSLVKTGRAMAHKTEEKYWPYIHVFLRPPEGLWKSPKWYLLPVYFWLDDVVEVGFQGREPVPVLIVKKVNYPDPDKYFSLLNP